MEAWLKGRRIFAEIEREWAEEFGEELIVKLREAAEQIAASERAAPEGRRSAA